MEKMTTTQAANLTNFLTLQDVKKLSEPVLK